MTIDDPLARFYEEESARNAGVKHPVTGIREPYNQAERQKLRDDEIKRKSLVTKRILAQVMGDELGREWLYDLLTQCNVFGTPYTIDPQATAYNAGALYIGRLIESDIRKHTPREYFAMIEEGWDRAKMWDEEVADKA